MMPLSLKAIMIDNYDSFTFNLLQYFGELGVRMQVVRNDAFSFDEIFSESVDFYVISPGPSSPVEAGLSLDLVHRCAKLKKPLFGVCLGHQCIGSAFGARIRKTHPPMHGKQSRIHTNQRGLFKGLPESFAVTRYHSLVVDSENLSNDLRVCARSDDGEIMALEHKNLPIFGVQFHPEAILTEYGKVIMKNLLTLVG